MKKDRQQMKTTIFVDRIEYSWIVCSLFERALLWGTKQKTSSLVSSVLERNWLIVKRSLYHVRTLKSFRIKYTWTTHWHKHKFIDDICVSHSITPSIFDSFVWMFSFALQHTTKIISITTPLQSIFVLCVCVGFLRAHWLLFCICDALFWDKMMTIITMTMMMMMIMEDANSFACVYLN